MFDCELKMSHNKKKSINLLSALQTFDEIFPFFPLPPFSCYGGLGRSALSKFDLFFKKMLNHLYWFSFTSLLTWLSHVFCCSVAACLLLQLSLTMTANKAIEILREHRGGGAIQTVKVSHFLSPPLTLEDHAAVFHVFTALNTIIQH